MVQARRKKPARVSPVKGSPARFGLMFAAVKRAIWIFGAGAMSGVLGLMLWQGYQSADQADLGSGLKAMINQSRLQAENRRNQTPAPEPILVDNTPKVKPEYDFYTVLPEIEEVMPQETPERASPQKAEKKRIVVDNISTKKKNKPQVAKARKGSDAYMLQVVSYGQIADAHRLKAKLALQGLQASVKEVSIRNKKYYRVSIGPYSDYGSMTADDYKLTTLGYKPLRLRLNAG